MLASSSKSGTLRVNVIGVIRERCFAGARRRTSDNW
jgi:hypothetical protein